MDLLRLGEKGLFSRQRRRKWLILMAVSCVSGYGVYKVYLSPSVTTKRKRLIKILGAFTSVSQLISDSVEIMTPVSQDLKRFLSSDSDDIPSSLKQIAKIATSDEFTSSLSMVSQAVTVGVSRGRSSFESTGIGSEPSVVDRVVAKVFSEEGAGFVSVVVGSFAKNLVLAFHSKEAKNDSEETPQWVSLLGDDKCRELIADCIERFTSTAVSVYLDKTMAINTYDQIFEGLTNPKHQDNVKDLLVTVSNGALQNIVRTSHDVLTSISSRSNTSSSRSKLKPVEGISTTLAVPSNRRFMFDVTGRVTLEAARSIFGFIMLKTLQGFSMVQEEVTERGRQVVGYVGGKSSVLLTVWLALYMHIISGCVRDSPIGVTC